MGTGAYRAAHGDHTLAMHYYATGYYQVAKRERPTDAGGQRDRTLGRSTVSLDLLRRKIKSQEAPPCPLSRSERH